jgi:hypothetical protein
MMKGQSDEMLNINIINYTMHNEKYEKVGAQLILNNVL